MVPKEKKITTRLTSKGFTPVHAAEVGVYNPETSNIYDFVLRGVRATLVEPDPESIRRINEHFAGRDNVTLHTVAVHDESGEVELSQRGASTFISSLKASPAIINDDYVPDEADKFTARAVTFDELDDGSIDLLSIDIEGGEWFVIKHMVSRPAVLSIETHGALYKNPYLAEISAWLEENGYQVWFKDSSDSVFVLPDVIPISSRDRLGLAWMNLRLRLGTLKKRISRRVKGRPAR